MGRPLIPNVEEIGGRFYYRTRSRNAEGKRVTQRVRLPHPTDPSFSTELARLSQRPEAPAVHGKDTMAYLVRKFRAKLPGRALKPNTLRNYERYLDEIERLYGDRAVTLLTRKACLQIRDGMAEKPGKANNFMSVLKALMDFAVDEEYRVDNPAAGIKRLAGGEHEPWPDYLIEQVLGRAPPMLRLAVLLGLETGQRVSDCIRMRHSWIKDSILDLRQLKSEKDASVVISERLWNEILKLPQKAPTILYTSHGKPFRDESSIQKPLHELLKELGHSEFSFHGLRKNACCKLLEEGKSDTVVGALLGMSPDMVRHYGKRVIVRRIAEGVRDGNREKPAKGAAGR